LNYQSEGLKRYGKGNDPPRNQERNGLGESPFSFSASVKKAHERLLRPEGRGPTKDLVKFRVANQNVVTGEISAKGGKKLAEKEKKKKQISTLTESSAQRWGSGGKLKGPCLCRSRTTRGVGERVKPQTHDHDKETKAKEEVK